MSFKPEFQFTVKIAKQIEDELDRLHRTTERKHKQTMKIFARLRDLIVIVKEDKSSIDEHLECMLDLVDDYLYS